MSLQETTEPGRKIVRVNIGFEICPAQGQHARVRTHFGSASKIGMEDIIFCCPDHHRALYGLEEMWEILRPDGSIGLHPTPPST